MSSVFENKCDFNGDTGWQVIRGTGFDAVRQVAIDKDGSALRFRRAAFINAVQNKAPSGPVVAAKLRATRRWRMAGAGPMRASP